MAYGVASTDDAPLKMPDGECIVSWMAPSCAGNSRDVSNESGVIMGASAENAMDSWVESQLVR